MSFDRVAAVYRMLETLAFGNSLQRCRTALLPELARARRVLIVGEGNGRFLVELLRANAEARVLCLDASQRMCDLAQERLRRAHPDARTRVRFLCATLETAELGDQPYDAVVTNFFLDCFEKSLPDVIAKLANAATHDARWLICDFRIPANGFAHWPARAITAVMYRFFQLAAGIEARRLTNWKPLLQAHRFRRRHCRLSCAGMLTSQLWRREITDASALKSSPRKFPPYSPRSPIP